MFTPDWAKLEVRISPWLGSVRYGNIETESITLRTRSYADSAQAVWWFLRASLKQESANSGK